LVVIFQWWRINEGRASLQRRSPDRGVVRLGDNASLNEGRASLHGEDQRQIRGTTIHLASMKAVHLCTAKYRKTVPIVGGYHLPQ